MATLHIVTAVLLSLSMVYADPSTLQGLYRAPNAGPRSDGTDSGSSGSARSGLIGAPDASDFSSSSGLSGSSGPLFVQSSSSGSGAVSTGSGSDSSTSDGARSSSADSGLITDERFGSIGLDDVTITQEVTVDVFKTVTNVIYNSIPITLTEFMKTTEIQPTLQVVSTAVDDNVFVATAPVTRTDSVTVTNVNTGYFYITQISTDLYTITHKAYQILQNTVTSTLQQTKVFRPTVVRTRINTEYDTQTVDFLVTNTVVIQPRSTLPFDLNTDAFTRGPIFGSQQVFGSQQGSGQGQIFGSQQGSGQGQQVFGSQQGSGQGQQVFGSQQGSGQGQQVFGSQQGSGQGQQVFGSQQGSGQGQQIFGTEQGSGQERPRGGLIGGQGIRASGESYGSY